ncbi:alpha-hydroxy acid oxidase [Novosphingobium sp. RD2P27]|uniref:Alpha-hydroxy acid oxidase n=1 Tax=Novosphingobium kalidii TaxID=3230299 RepID=A0ABV2D1I3_9SPHN
MTALLRRYRTRGRVERAHSIAELRAMALRRLPRLAAEYLESGAEDELSLAANRAAFDGMEFMPRMGGGKSEVPATSGRLAHQALPYVIAPTGLNGLQWREADLALARGAAGAGVVFTQSTVSNTDVGEIARTPGLAHWFQLYVFSDMQLVLALMARAYEAGVRTLVVTVDANTVGNREWDTRLYARPGVPTPAARIDALLHPRWFASVYLPGLPSFPNLTEALGGRRDLIAASHWLRDNIAPHVTWVQLEQIRAAWTGDLLIKGIAHLADAREAIAIGAQGVVLGNHGGRQLDGAVSGLSLLRQVRDDLGAGPTILVEGGVRRGNDILKARLLGADAVMGGRATLYGVAAGGEAGVARALTILRTEYDRSVRLLGSGELAPKRGNKGRDAV